ncbi:Holliday junction resolvase RecU [Bacillus swezeyi]|uniref:Holliday junction resolvase RecU n=1 Tax=Bacillus swezeyi TaxID=1925020 RepID=UPI0027DE2A4B|nr:Holliday junction resolvase RecU [Bacillus swezeyi]
MINYANRGKALQMLINNTNAVYKQKGWALVDEVPTPSKNIKGRIIYERKSTVDYYGISQGRGIAFDAKSTKETKRFDLKNVHDHQVKYLDHFLKQGGIAFLLIEFARLREFYFVSIPFFLEYWNAAKNGGRKSIPYEEIRFNCAPIRTRRGVPLDYLELCFKNVENRGLIFDGML